MNERPEIVCATCGTDEKALYDAVAKVIEQYKEKEGSLIMVLHAAQEIFGYLPEEVQIMVAEGLDIPLSEVYGVASFYAQFSMNPKGKYQISVCLGTACYVKGAAAVLNAVEQKLGLALADPAKITTATVQDVKKCLELVAELEAGLPKENEAEESKKRGLSGDMAQSIYKALGITEETE